MNLACSQNYKRRSSFKILTGKPEEEIPLGRPRDKRMGHVRRDMREIDDNARNWINLSDNRNCWRAFELPGFIRN